MRNQNSVPASPVIHIGYHKTASTWFQKQFYPELCKAEYIDRDKVKQAFLIPNAFDFSPDEARSVFPDSDNNRLVLCDENLSGGIQNGGVHGLLSKEIGTRIQTVFPSASVVVFIRNQYNMIASSYKQYVLRGGTRSMKEYLFPSYPQFKYPLFSVDHLKYHQLIDHYVSLFGRDNVYIYRFEEFRSDTFDFLKKYCRQLKLNIDVDEIQLSNENPSDQCLIHYVRKTLNHFSSEAVPHKHYFFSIPGFFTLYRRGLNYLNRFDVFGGKLGYRELISRKLINRLGSIYSRSNQKLINEFDLDVGEYNYPTP